MNWGMMATGTLAHIKMQDLSVHHIGGESFSEAMVLLEPITSNSGCSGRNVDSLLENDSPKAGE
jgi:hypothetical protein